MILLDKGERERLSKLFSERERLSKRLAGHNANRAEEWNRYLVEHREILEKLRPPHLKALENSLQSLRQLELIEELLKIPHIDDPLRKTLFDVFIERVDESAFELSQWVEALEIFDVWLTKNARTADVPKMLGYLECCAKSIENKEYPLRLKDLCAEMLEQYGFLG